jgi:hypothetical protein
MTYFAAPRAPAGFLDVTTRGARPDSGLDCLQALVDASQLGMPLYFPSGIYTISDTWIIQRQLVIRCAGGMFGAAPTRIHIPFCKTGIIVKPWSGGPASARGDYTIISDLTLVPVQNPSFWTANAGGWQVGNFCQPSQLNKNGFCYECTARDFPGVTGPTEPVWPTTIGETIQDGSITWTCRQQNGIELQTRASIERIGIVFCVGHGVSIEATAGAGTNANNWMITGGRINNCAGHGIHVKGEDTNAGVCSGVDCSANGGAGFYDASFLGNTYVGCHVADNKQASYYSASVVAANTFVGCYSESGAPGSYGSGSACTFVGGLHAAGFLPNDVSVHVNVDGFSRRGVWRNEGGDIGVIARLAPTDTVRTALDFARSDGGDAMRFGLNHPGLLWHWSFISGAAGPMLGLPNQMAYEFPRPVMPNGVQFGTSAGFPVAVSTHPTFLTTGHRNRGDRYESTTPSAGGYAGKISVRAGWAAPLWTGLTQYSVGALVVPTADNTFVYECTQAGTSAPLEQQPIWPTTPGQTVFDGSAVWQCGRVATTWQANTPYTLNTFALPIAGGAFVYRCVVPGTSGASQPVWPTSFFSQSIVDGTVTWRLEGWRAQAALWKDWGAIAQ